MGRLGKPQQRASQLDAAQKGLRPVQAHLAHAAGERAAQRRDVAVGVDGAAAHGLGVKGADQAGKALPQRHRAQAVEAREGVKHAVEPAEGFHGVVIAQQAVFAEPFGVKLQKISQVAAGEHGGQEGHFLVFGMGAAGMHVHGDDFVRALLQGQVDGQVVIIAAVERSARRRWSAWGRPENRRWRPAASRSTVPAECPGACARPASGRGI